MISLFSRGNRSLEWKVNAQQQWSLSGITTLDRPGTAGWNRPKHHGLDA
jgi:hypothetical protein